MVSIEKVTEVAAWFVNQTVAREMRYVDLMKLLYLADREHLNRKGRTISSDLYWSLPWGPVLGYTLDAIRYGNDAIWNRHFSVDLNRKTIRLIADAPPQALSRGELATVSNVWSRYGVLGSSELMLITHSLPEYQDTEGRVEIRLEEIAFALGKSEDDVLKILEFERELHAVQRFKVSLSVGRHSVIA